MSASELVPTVPVGLSPRAQYMILAAAFLAWMFAGGQMAITALASRDSTRDMLYHDQEATTQAEEDERRLVIGQWFAKDNAAFLLGASLGGLIFGWFGDRLGRSRAMGVSILTYTGFCGLAYFAETPQQWMILRFLSGLGVGGTWPNGIALVQEAWSNTSRPLLAGLIGTAANVGLMLVPFISLWGAVTTKTWRWAMLATAVPLPLGLIVLAWLPESPRWLAQRMKPRDSLPVSPLVEVFWPPFLFTTIVGILLATIPLFGGWGNGNWLINWSDHASGMTDPSLKAWTQFFRAFGGTIGSLIGGGLAAWVGRRRSYFLMSVTSFAIAQYIYGQLEPKHPWFSTWTFIQGIVGGLYFGWLPLCLPEMFPTRVRSTGAGVTFNFGRILTAAGVVGMASLLNSFENDYAKVGSMTGLVYILGMIVIWFAPVSGELKEDK